MNVGIALVILTTTLQQDRGHALHFANDQDKVWTSDSLALHISGEMTVEAWVKPEPEMRGRKTGFIVSKTDQKGGFELKIWGVGDQKCFVFAALPNAPLRYEAPAELFWNRCWHVAGVVGRSSIGLIVNGKLVAEEAIEHPLSWSENQLDIGNSPFAHGHWTGMIDEVRLWNVAHSPLEIETLANKRLHGNETGLVSCWDFEEGHGDQTRDITGHTATAQLGKLDKQGRRINRPTWVPGVPMTP